MFTTRSKHRRGIDPTVIQLRVDGEWLAIVRGSFYTDGDGGFACTAAYAARSERVELTGPVGAIEDVRRDLPAAVEPSMSRRPTRHAMRRPQPQLH